MQTVGDKGENDSMPDEDTYPASSTDPAIQRLEDLIQRSLPALARPGEDPPEYARSAVEVTPGEAQGFFRAIDAGLFVLERDAQCRPIGLRAGYYCYPLLYRPLNAVNEVILWREWLTHAAAVASLHGDFHYPRYDIALDVDAFDVLVYSRLNQPLLAVEAKKTSKELDRMLAEINTLPRHTWELKCNAPRLSNAAKKYRGLLALRPEFFLAVAPGISRAYAVHYPDDRAVQRAELMPIEGIAAATDP